MNFKIQLFILGVRCAKNVVQRPKIKVLSPRIFLSRHLCNNNNNGSINGPSTEMKSAVENDDLPEWSMDILVKQDDILNAINTFNPHKLCKYRNLSMRLSMAIINERDERGPFKDMSDLLRVRGLGSRTLDRFRADGLRPRGIRIEPLSRYAYAVSSSGQISKEKLQVFESVVTLEIGLKHFAWLQMDRGRCVRDWRIIELEDISPGKYDPAAYLKSLQKIVDEIPRPDLYILEHKTYLKTNKTSYQVTLFLRTLESILFGLLNANFADTGELECVSLSQQKVGKHFGLIVGTRRRSGQEIVRHLLKRGLNKENEKVPIRFRSEDIEIFDTANNFERELLANTVLKAVTFFDNMIDNKEF